MKDKPTNQVSKKDKLVYSKVYSSKGLMKLDKETEKRFDEQFLDAGEWRHSPITQNEIKQFLASEKELSRQEERARILEILDDKENLIDALGNGQCNDSLSAQLDGIREKLTKE